MKSKFKIVVRAGVSTAVAVAVAGTVVLTTILNHDKTMDAMNLGSIQAEENNAWITSQSKESFWKEAEQEDDELEAGEGKSQEANFTVSKVNVKIEQSGSANIWSAANSSKETTPLSQYFADKAIVNGDLIEGCLNVRTEPGNTSDDTILGQIEPNEILTVLDAADNWVLVSSKAGEGWVSEEYLLKGLDAAKYVEAYAKPYAEVAVSSMNIRFGKSTSSDILDTAEKGEAFPLVSIEDGWACVQLDGALKGYLAGNCVTINYDWNGLVIATGFAGAAEENVKDLAGTLERPSILSSSAAEAPSQPEELTQPNPTQPPEEPEQAEPTQPPLETPAQPVTEPDSPAVPENPTDSVDPTVPSPENPQGPVLTGIEAFYIGQPKTEGEVIGYAEICVSLYFDDGSVQTIMEGWTSEDIGMILHAGEEIIRVSYGGFSSNIVLNVAPSQTEPENPSVPEDINPTAPTPEVPENPEIPPVTEPEVPTEPPVPDTQPEAPILTGIEAFYTGAQKTEGEVVSYSEIYVQLYYSDGSFETIAEGWTSDKVGMVLCAGEEIIPVSYGGFTSNIVLNVAASSPTPTEPSVPEDNPSEPTPETPSEEPTEEQPVATVPDSEYVNNVPLSGELTAHTLRLCREYGIDSSIIFSVMYQESRFDPNATSPSGAIGLMQIIPRYCQERMDRLGVTDLYDSASNIAVGVDMLADYYYTYGSWVHALTRYRYGNPNGSNDYANLILSNASMFK